MCHLKVVRDDYIFQFRKNIKIYVVVHTTKQFVELHCCDLSTTMDACALGDYFYIPVDQSGGSYGHKVIIPPFGAAFCPATCRQLVDLRFQLLDLESNSFAYPNKDI